MVTNQSMSQYKTYNLFDNQRCLNNIFHFIIEFQSIKIDFIMFAHVTLGNELLLQIYWKFILCHFMAASDLIINRSSEKNESMN